MEEIQIDKESFEYLAPMLRPYLKEHCNYCGCKITKDTFGLLAKEITCCGNIVCLTQSIGDMDKLTKQT